MTEETNDGKVPCRECGARWTIGNKALAPYFTCGDCLEGRTPLKREIEQLKAEVLEARNEASVVRRAYLHEKSRADVACAELVGSSDAHLRRMGERLAARAQDDERYQAAMRKVRGSEWPR